VGLNEWSVLVKDARLLKPLFVAYTKLDLWRPIARASTIRGTTYTVAHLDPHIGGYYSPGFLTAGQVVINDSVLAEPIDVQVAVLAHELYHSQSITVGGAANAAACMSEEMNAMVWEAYGYALVVRPDGVETVWTLTEDHRRDLLRQNRLQEEVLLSEGYQRECLGGVVK